MATSTKYFAFCLCIMLASFEVFVEGQGMGGLGMGRQKNHHGGGGNSGLEALLAAGVVASILKHQQKSHHHHEEGRHALPPPPPPPHMHIPRAAVHEAAASMPMPYYYHAFHVQHPFHAHHMFPQPHVFHVPQGFPHGLNIVYRHHMPRFSEF